MADNKENQVPLEGPGNANQGMAKVINVAKIVGVILGLVAAAIISLPAQGIEIPAALLTVAQALLGILASLGLASSGLKPKA